MTSSQSACCQRALCLYDLDGFTVRAFDILTRSLSTTEFVFLFNFDSKLRRLSSVCRWRKLLFCRIYESSRPFLLFGLCSELIGMALPFVVIQADRRRGVSSKEVVLIVFFLDWGGFCFLLIKCLVCCLLLHVRILIVGNLWDVGPSFS